MILAYTAFAKQRCKPGLATGHTVIKSPGCREALIKSAAKALELI